MELVIAQTDVFIERSCAIVVDWSIVRVELMFLRYNNIMNNANNNNNLDLNRYCRCVNLHFKLN